eukprot:g1717.t1
MTDTASWFGSENSPYSIKVRAFFRYKNIPHTWLIRNHETAEEFEKVAKLPLVPAVSSPLGENMQDSTPIIEMLEARFPSPAADPTDATLKFISQLLEEFGDEWGNKWMFHFRWAREVDQKTVARRLVSEMLGPGAEEEQLEQMAGMVQQRMSGRGFAIGSNEVTAPLIEASFEEGLRMLEAHLSAGPGRGGRPFLLGARPAFADFGLAPQLYQALLDPTAGAIMRAAAPRVVAWCEGMLDPRSPASGGGGGGAFDFEPWAALAPTLEPLLSSQVATFLRWSDANARAIAAKAKELRVELRQGGKAALWTQSVGGPQRYHAKSLRELRGKYAAVAADAQLRGVLQRCGCLQFLQQQQGATLGSKL